MKTPLDWYNEDLKKPKGAFALALPKQPNAFKAYVPPVHPHADRLEQFRELKSLWTGPRHD